MGDMRGVFDILTEERKQRREERRAENEAILRAGPRPWTVTNNGANWILRVAGLPKIDFYPGTGRWRVAGNPKTFTGGAAALLRWLDRGGHPMSDGEAVDSGAYRPVDLDEAIAEVERLRAVITAEPDLVRLSYSVGKPLEMAMRHPLVLALVRALRDTLEAGDGPAPNYVEAIVRDTERTPSREYVVTVQRKEGKTPHQLRRDAEARVMELEAAAASREPTP